MPARCLAGANGDTTGTVDALLGVHGAGVDIEVRVHLDGRDVRGRQHGEQHASRRATYLEPDGLEQQARRRGCDASSQLAGRSVVAAIEPHTYDALARGGLAARPRGACRWLTFPTPLMTPPDTSTYFMVACGAVGEGERRNGSSTAVKEICRRASCAGVGQASRAGRPANFRGLRPSSCSRMSISTSLAASPHPRRATSRTKGDIIQDIHCYHARWCSVDALRPCAPPLCCQSIQSLIVYSSVRARARKRPAPRHHESKWCSCDREKCQSISEKMLQMSKISVMPPVSLNAQINVLVIW